jgi:hypothetical protein
MINYYRFANFQGGVLQVIIITIIWFIEKTVFRRKNSHVAMLGDNSVTNLNLCGNLLSIGIGNEIVFIGLMTLSPF